jgi:hypothetical protein
MYNIMVKTELSYPKNVGAWVGMDFTQNEYLSPRTIEKRKILGGCFGATS